VYIGNKRNGSHTLFRRGADIPDDSPIFSTQAPNTPQASHKLTTRDANATEISIDEIAQEQKIVWYFNKYHHRIVFAGELNHYRRQIRC
jgi:hypothetical protein